MQFHAPTGQFTIDINSCENAAHNFLFAMAHIRKMNNLPLGAYELDGALSSADHSQKAIIDGAKAMGIDLGACWGNEIDLSKFKTN